MERLIDFAYRAHDFCEKYLFDVSQLFMRIMIFRVCFYSGLAKIRDWETTLFLFEVEYAIPFIPFEIAAYLATFSELLFPALILIGVTTRLSTIPLLILVIVIEFVLGTINPTYSNISHFMYIALLFAIFVKGAGKFSLDYIIASNVNLFKKKS